MVSSTDAFQRSKKKGEKKRNPTYCEQPNCWLNKKENEKNIIKKSRLDVLSNSWKWKNIFFTTCECKVVTKTWKYVGSKKTKIHRFKLREARRRMIYHVFLPLFESYYRYWNYISRECYFRSVLKLQI